MIWLLSCSAQAELRLDPSLVFGYNSDQGSYGRLGLDLVYQLDANISFGLQTYIASPSANPETSREIAGGAFGQYVWAMSREIFLIARQEVNYVDQREPLEPSRLPDGRLNYESMYGVISATSVGAQMQISNFAASFGYRQVIGLSRSELGEGRSGVYIGVGIGI